MCTSGTGSTNRTLKNNLVTAVMLTQVQQRLFSGIKTLTKSNRWKLKLGFIFHLNLLMKTKNQSSEPPSWIRNAVSWDTGPNMDPHGSCNPVWARSTIPPVLDRRGDRNAVQFLGVKGLLQLLQACACKASRPVATFLSKGKAGSYSSMLWVL